MSAARTVKEVAAAASAIRASTDSPYLLRKMSYDVAPVALGLVLAPMLELSMRQSLAMSGGSYQIFLDRPFALALLGILLALVALAVLPQRFKPNWRKAEVQSEGASSGQ